jgi:signal transduction histidine kinase
MRPRQPALPPLVRELVGVVQTLSVATEVETVQAVVLHAVRRLTGADGVTFVVRDGDRCFYVDEDAIAPLWKGQRFPSSACISGWVMEHGQPAVVPDITTDARIPLDVYQPTFVRSLAMVPIRAVDPLGAIGLYWSEPHTATRADVEAVQAIADATAVTMERLRSDRALVGRVAELEEANRALADANGRLEHVASVVAHDLRSPLATVDGLLGLLGRAVDGGDGDLATEVIGRTSAQIGRLMDSVEALMSLSQARMDPLLLEDLDVAEVVGEVVSGLDADLADAGAQVHVDEGRVRGDRVLVRLLLQNLIANAIRYRDPQRPQVVHIGLERRGAGSELSVTDRGIGLEPDILESLFELGEPPATRRGAGHGTGIGLVTCRRIAERHGGHIAAEPRADGARFVVWFPDETADTDRPEATAG